MATSRSKGKQPELETPETPEPPPPPDIKKIYEELGLYNPVLNAKATNIAFIDYVLDLYDQDGHEGDDLTDVFRQDFQMFTKKDWKILSASKLTKIRASLRKKGFYIPIRTKMDAAESIEAAIREDLPWPTDDPLCPGYLKGRQPERSDGPHQFTHDAASDPSRGPPDATPQGWPASTMPKQGQGRMFPYPPGPMPMTPRIPTPMITLPPSLPPPMPHPPLTVTPAADRHTRRIPPAAPPSPRSRENTDSPRNDPNGTSNTC